MKIIKKILIAVIVIIVTAIAGLVLYRWPAPSTGESIKIGVLSALTGSYSAYGQPGVRAIQIALDEIGHKVNGAKIELVIEDTQNDPKTIASAAQKLISVDKVSIILADSSTATLTAAPLAEAHRIPLIAFLSTSPEITRAGDYIFRTSPSNTEGMSQTARLAFTRLAYKKIAVISEIKDYTLGIKSVFDKAFKDFGGSVVADESFESKTTDVKTQLLKIQRSNPQAILILAQSPGTGALVIKQIKELNIRIPILANEGAANEETIRLVGEAAEGIIFSEPDFNIEKGKMAILVKKYKEGNHETPPQWLYVATAYDALHIATEAIGTVGTRGENIKNYLYTIKDREGAAGKLSFDRNGDPQFSYILKVITKGKIEKYNSGE